MFLKKSIAKGKSYYPLAESFREGAVFSAWGSQAAMKNGNPF
jgi:hypothetical protein